MNTVRNLIKLGLFFFLHSVFAQVSPPFQEEVNEILSRYSDGKPINPIIFTGSSTIKMWRTLQELNPNKMILNHGFGGSQTSDLIIYTKDLITDFEPTMIFIYEGDNDLANNKTVNQIISETKALIQRIRKKASKTPIYLISPKPSINRWHLNLQFEDINTALQELTVKENAIGFIDLWTPMLDEKGVVQGDLFLSDNLHMNEKGYAIWHRVIWEYLK